MTIEVGLGLWSMQATAFAPAGWPAMYAALADEAREVEALGFDGMWFAEHHFWYDGWCPQPVVAAAVAAAATSTLRVGTAMHLLPQHDPVEVARMATTLHRLSGGRLDLGFGLGYRDAEFDGVGLEIRRRGTRMDHGLDHLAEHWGATATGRAASAPRVMVGGLAPKAIERAAKRGLGLLLPPSLRATEVATALANARLIAAQHNTSVGRIGMMIDVWLDDDGDCAREFFIPRLRTHYKEYAGAWWQIKGRPGFEVPDSLERQMDRSAAAMVVGNVDEVTARLVELAEVGIDVFGLQIQSDVTRDRWRDVAANLAKRVVPTLKAVAA